MRSFRPKYQADQGQYEEEDRRLQEEIEEAVDLLPDRPARSDVERVLRAQRQEYVTYARRNAGRLDRIYAALHRFVRIVMIIGVIFAITQLVLGGIAVDLFNGQAKTSRLALSTVFSAQEGRRVSLRVVCAVESAIAETGRNVIAGSSTPPPAPQERAFKALGFPPFKVRHAQQEHQSDAYVASISRAVDKALGDTKHRARRNKLVLHNGTLNCHRLTQIAHLHP